MASEVTARLRTQLGASVGAAFIQLGTALHVSAAHTEPSSAAELLARPDVALQAGQVLDGARQSALSLVTYAWERAAGTLDSEVLQALLGDVQRAYDDAPDRLRAVVASALPDGPLAVSQAVQGLGSELALRSKLTLDAAGGYGATAAVVAEGEAREASGEWVYKRWRSRKTARTCRWCWDLDGVTVGLHEEFPHPAHHPGGPHPPKVYGGHLAGPQLHPHCECWAELVSGPVTEAGGQEPVPPPAHRFLSADDIRAMPEDTYQAMLSFVRAATHELGKILRRLSGHG